MLAKEINTISCGESSVAKYVPDFIVYQISCAEHSKKAPNGAFLQENQTENYIIPPMPPIPPISGIGGAGLSSGISAIIASVVIRRPAIDAAF